MPRITLTTAAITLVLIWSTPAFSQVRWSGVYVGADFGAGFKDLDFIVNDDAQASCCEIQNGHAGHGLTAGVHVGLNHQFGNRIVVGGEAGFGQLRYHGEVFYSLGSDTLAETDGGRYWTAMARVGFVVNRVMPYFAAGVINSRNTADIVDECNTLPCGSSLGEGSNTVSATRWTYAFGAEFAMHHRAAMRLEWMQVEPTAVLNSFEWTLTGIGLGNGRAFPADVSTNLPHGMLRVLVDVRLTK